MAIAQHTIDLINADIDGEISASEKRELEAVLATSSEAKALHADLSVLCQAMDSAEAVVPPTYLRHSILEMTGSMRSRSRLATPARRFLSSPALRFTGAFAAGVVLALGIFSISKMPATKFDDLTGLVGTISDRGAGSADKSLIYIGRSDISGSVAIHRSGQLLIVDLDLVSQVPVDVVTEFPGKDVWFNGFAQLESSGTSVAAEPGRVTVRAEGKRRYAIYLHDADGKDTTVDLRFVAGGTVIHAVQLVSDESIE